MDPLVISEDFELTLDQKYILVHLILASFCLDQEVARLTSGDSLASLKRLHK